MNPETLKAHVAQFRDIAKQYDGDEQEGAKEIVFLLGRASRLADQMVEDVTHSLPPAA